MAERVHRVMQTALVSVALLAALVAGPFVLAAEGVAATAYDYDAPGVARADAQKAASTEGAFSVALAGDGIAPTPAVATGGAATTLVSLTHTPSATGGGARFVANSAGDVLDTTRIAIPQGKFGYLLNNPSKSGVFSDSMGFTEGTLGPALRGHLVDNFGTATRSVPMVGGGTKFSVTGPLTGPSGQKWNITTAWGVDPDGTVRLITATP